MKADEKIERNEDHANSWRAWEVVTFINQPSPWPLRVIVLVVALSALALSVGSPFVNIHRKVKAPGSIVSELGVRQIQSVRAGTFRRVAKENESVKEGDLLGYIEIRGINADEVQPLLGLLDSIASDKNLVGLQTIGIKIKELRSVADKFMGLHAEAEIGYPLTELFSQYDALVNSMNGLARAERQETSPLRASATKLGAKISSLRKGKRKQKDLEFFIETIEEDRRKLTSSIANVENTYRLRSAEAIQAFRNIAKRTSVQVGVFAKGADIRAPIAGRLYRWRVPDKAQVQSEMVVADVLPSDSRVITKLLVKATDQPKIAPGQSTYMKLEAFPHQQYGLFKGTVIDVKQVSEEGAFNVTTSIDSSDRVPASSFPIGSTLEADIVVGSDSLFDVAVEKIMGMRP